MDLVPRITAGRADRLADQQSRRALVVEFFRQLAVQDFDALYASPSVRTYLALRATFLSLADGGLRDQVAQVPAAGGGPASPSRRHASRGRLTHPTSWLEASDVGFRPGSGPLVRDHRHRIRRASSLPGRFGAWQS